MYGLGALGKSGTELPPLPTKRSDPIPEESKDREEIRLPAIYPKLSPILEKPPQAISTPKKSPKRPSVRSSVAAHEEIEEDLDTQADGLLRWVEELPEEMSASASNPKLAIAL